MRTFRLALLASTTFAVACSDEVTAPAGPTIAGSPNLSPLFSTSEGTTAESDSVVAGYGCEATGGIEYECFEYDPDCGTERTCPPPPPPPSTSPTPSDSVTSGYGSGSTGGIEYDSFEYDPETGTETVASSDGSDR